MRKLLAVAFVATLFLSSCPNIADKYNLPEDPIGEITVEMADASLVSKSPFSAVLYSNFMLSHTKWANYVQKKASMMYEGVTGEPSTKDLSVSEDYQGNIWGTYTQYFQCFYQGMNILTLSASDGQNNVELFRKRFPVGSGQKKDPFISLTESTEYTPRAPYLIDKAPTYDVAVSDDKKTLFVKPVDELAASRYASLVLFNVASHKKDHALKLFNDAMLSVSLSPSNMKVGSWTKIDISLVTPLKEKTQEIWEDTNTTASTIRSQWSYHIWSTGRSKTDWGYEIRSIVLGGNLNPAAPATSDAIFDPAAQSSRSLGFVASPLFDQIYGLKQN